MCFFVESLDVNSAETEDHCTKIKTASGCKSIHVLELFDLILIVSVDMCLFVTAGQISFSAVPLMKQESR